MKPAAPGDTQPLSPVQPPLRLLRWQARTQVFHEELGEAERLTMVRIPAGSFQMGSAEQEAGRVANEGPLHTVALAEFLIGQTPITQAQWRAVARWTPQQGERWGRDLNPDPSHFQTREGQAEGEVRLFEGEDNTDNRPVEQVSRLDAMEFCSRLSQRTGCTYTLPSEAQWEYACRAATTISFNFGETISPELANYNGSYVYATGPKGIYRGQATPVGMSRLMLGACMTCMVMYGNAVWMNGTIVTKEHPPMAEPGWMLRKGKRVKNQQTPSCCAAAPGSTAPGTAARLAATTTGRYMPTTSSWVSVWSASPRALLLTLNPSIPQQSPVFNPGC